MADLCVGPGWQQSGAHGFLDPGGLSRYIKQPAGLVLVVSRRRMRACVPEVYPF